MSRPGARVRGNLLTVLAALLIVKTALTLAAIGGADNPAAPAVAHAQAPAQPETTPTTQPADQTQAEPAPAAPPPKEPAPGELDLEILKEVEKRKIDLDQRERELAQKEERLRAMQEDLGRKISELQAVRTGIEEQIQLRKDLETQAVQKLAKTYASMPPENAAALIQQIDTAIAIRILAAMKERSAGRILAVIPPARASKLSEGLVRKK